MKRTGIITVSCVALGLALQIQIMVLVGFITWRGDSDQSIASSWLGETWDAAFIDVNRTLSWPMPGSLPLPMPLQGVLFMLGQLLRGALIGAISWLVFPRLKRWILG